MRLNAASRLLPLAATVTILVATLRPDFSRETQSWTNCIVCGEQGTADALVNLILFMPLGLGLAIAGIPLRRAIIAGALLSALIELAQAVIPGRDPSLRDVLSNTLGTAVGVAVGVLAPRTRGLSRAGAARLSLLAAGVFATVTATTGVLLRPRYPQAVYYGQWTPLVGHLEWYGGRVESSHVGDVPIRPGRIERSEAVRDLLIRGAPITVSAVAGQAPPGLSSVLSIYDQYQREVMLLGPDGNDLVYRYRTVAAALGLDQPEVRVAGALREFRPGDSLRVVAWRPRGGRFCIALGRSTTCGLGFSAGAGWTLLYYSRRLPTGAVAMLDALWLAGLVAPVGFWLRRRFETALALGIAAATLWWLPALVGLKPAGVVPSLAVLGTTVLTCYWGRRSFHGVALPPHA